MRRRHQQTISTTDACSREPNQIEKSTAKKPGNMITPQTLSILNLLAYTLNTLETFGIGPFSIHFNPDQDNASVSAKYQTIITPHGIAFSIWGIIFLAEAIFVGATLLNEKLRESVLVVDGVSYWFVLVCLAQTAWSPAFAYEKIPLSAFFMGCILLPLLAIVINHYKITTNRIFQRSDYWILQFPFEIHTGWICAAFALNLNILGVALGANAETQVVVAAISLVVLTVVALVCLGLKRPQFTLPWVVVWATFWISYELSNPKQLIIDTFSSDQIHAFFVSIRSLSGVLALLTLMRWIQNALVATKTTSNESDMLLRSDGGA